jgi:hypothetical protein
MEDTMGSVSKLKLHGNANADPLRATLVAAQEKAHSARQAVERQKQAVQRLWDETREAEEQVEKLQKRVGEAQEAHIAGLAEAAATGEAPPASGVPKAKKAVEAATDHIEALKAARRKLEADAPELQKDIVTCDAEVERLISEILKPVAEAIIERGRQIAELLAPIKRTLSALWSESDRPTQWDAQAAFDTGRAPLKETKAAAAEWLRSMNAIERAVPDPWIEARKRLREDPNAALPELLTALLGP